MDGQAAGAGTSAQLLRLLFSRQQFKLVPLEDRSSATFLRLLFA
jgi:hypothetical protein